LSGGVALYAAQSNVQIDAEIAEKDGFRSETNQGRRKTNAKRRYERCTRGIG
jgi:hypothetical protein